MAGDRDGPDERFEGAVANFAISRPSSPTLPCSSVISSRISCSSSVGRAFPCSLFSLGSRVDKVSFSFSLSTSHRSTSLMRSSKARTCPTVHFSSFSKRFAITSKVPGTSKVPCPLNWAYKGGASRGDAPASCRASTECIGEGLRSVGTFGRNGVGEAGEVGTGFRWMKGGVFMKAGLVNLSSAIACHSFSLLFPFFFVSFSRAFVSWMTC